MSSIWKLGSVDIYVTGSSPTGDVKLAKLTPLDSIASSTVHYFGSGAEEMELKGWVISETNANAIKTYIDNGTTIALTSDQGSEGNYIINTFNLEKFGPFVRLNLAGYAANATIYRFTAKLIKV